jgi:succinoglycan biosynthesis transport protein ExoP
MIDSPALARDGPSRTGIAEILYFVYRRKIVILAPAVLMAVVGWTIGSTTAPRYAAEAVLAFDLRRVQVVEHDVVSRLPQESSAMGAALRTELDIITSRSLAEQLVDRLRLAADPDVLREANSVHSPLQYVAGIAQRALGHLIAWIPWIGPVGTTDTFPSPARSLLTNWLIDNLRVSNDGRSFTILVSFTSESRDRAAWIANAVAEYYLDDQIRTTAMATAKASGWLGKELTKLRQDLESSEAAVDDFRRESGLIEAKGATTPAQRLSDLNSQLVNAGTERARVESKLQTARESSPDTIPDVLASPTIQQLRKDIARISEQIAEKTYFGTSYKSNILDAQVAGLRKQVNLEMSRILASLTGEVEAARAKEAQLAQLFRQMESRMGDASRSSIQLIQLQREADANRSIYESFLSRYKQSIEQQDLAVPDARLISRAEPPRIPSYPKKLTTVLLGTFGGLVIGVALAYVREGFDQRVRQASEVEAVTGIPVFGLMPRVSRWRRLQPQDYPVREARSRFCTALVQIHTALRVPMSSVRNQVILVTSAKAGEGKTSFCTSLARSLAKSRTRVLVIDADSYRSQVAAAFGASIFPNFGPIVGDRVRLCDIVQTDTKSTAHFIAAPHPDDLQLLLHSGAFEMLIEEGRRAYDVVILDTPPVMTSADAAVIGRFADTCLFLVRWGRTSWDELTSSVRYLRLCGIKLHGVVMSSVDSVHAHYGQTGGYTTMSSDAPRFMVPHSERKLTETERAA